MNYGGSIEGTLVGGNTWCNLFDADLMAVRNSLDKLSLRRKVLSRCFFGTSRFITQLGFYYSHGSSLNRFDFGRVSNSQWGMPYRTCMLKHWPAYRARRSTHCQDQLWAADLEGIIAWKLWSRCRLCLHSKWPCE